MADVNLRKMCLAIEEVFHDGGPVATTPSRRGAAIAVIKNPFADRYEDEIASFMEALRPVGLTLAKNLVARLGGAENIEGYGKAAIVGVGGELEHGALWHAPGGYAMREVLGGTKAIVPSAKKVAAAGARIDVPIAHIQAAYVRSHFDSMEVGLHDAPHSDEVAYVLVMTTGPRIHARVGGLRAADIIGDDGLR
ncbi:MAG: amino acid synthesis family protein [Aestuariivita sp.]|nr:amino acid synthesis family protein [Aestuariivita sp.]MCY4202617.1 amino acid synthesis family protein [Aestuariivita sp.]